MTSHQCRLFLVSVAALCVMAIAAPVVQACSLEDVDKAYKDLVAADEALQQARDEKRAAGDPLAGPVYNKYYDAGEKWDQARKRYSDAQRCLKIEARGDGFHTVSIPGFGFLVVADKDFNDFVPASKSRAFFDGQSGPSAGHALTQGLPKFSLAWVGEFGLERGAGATLLAFQGGVRMRMTLMSHPKVAPFAQVLTGIEHCGLCQYTAFSLQPGFGILYAVSPRIGVLGQFDIRIVPSSETELLFGGGITFALKK